MKLCKKCQIEKPLSDFTSDATKKDGKSTHCRECRSVAHADWRKRNPDKIRSNLLKKYGLTIEDYEMLLLSQANKCAICWITPRTKRLAVDHNHKTGEVRGLLCSKCNKEMLGGAKENPDILRRAAEYLENPPARAVLHKGEENDLREL